MSSQKDQNLTTQSLITPGKLFTRILACTLIICIITEVFLRLFITAPSRQVFDSALGWRYKPNSTLIHSGEGYAYHQLNELGMNDEALNSKAKAKKVLVSGDSFVEALEVDRENNFVSLLAQQKKTFDFINSGRGDFTPLHQTIVLDRMLQRITPSLNLFFISVGDIGALLETPAKIERQANGKITHLTPISPDKDALKDKFRLFLHNSSLLTYLMRRYHKELKGLIAFIQQPCFVNCDQEEKTTNTPSASNTARNNEKKERLRYTLEYLNQRTPTIVFYIPTIFYYPEGRASVSDFSKREIGIIQDVIKKTGIHFINLAPILRADYKKTGIPGFGFHNTRIGGEGHLNKHGHRVVANHIIEEIEFPQ